MRIAGIPVSKWIKRLAVVAVLAAIVAVIAWSLVPRPVPVDTAPVGRGRLVVTIDEDGLARVRDRYVVTAPLGGMLGRIELEPGDEIAAGDVLARIAPLPSPLLDDRTRAELDGRVAIAQARVRQVTSAVARAEAAAAFADAELARMKTLAAQGAVAGIAAERAQLEADLAARALDSVRFEAAIARDEVTTARAIVKRAARGGTEEIAVTSPVAGRILRVLAPDEGGVAPGSPLIELGDPARLEIAIDVLTADAVEISTGAPVELTGWGGVPLHAVVRLVEPSATTRVSALGVEEQRVTVIADLVDPAGMWQRLGDGWRIEARITTWVADDRLTVPLAALFRDGEVWAVYVVEDGRAHTRHVEIGRRNAVVAEVRDGIAEGEVVILHPSERVGDGVRVEEPR